MDTYKTISSPAQAKITVKKSSFLAFAHPIDSEEEATALIRDYRKQYYDARHVCYAYRTLTEDKYSDNGEPSGTAGRPMMGALQSADVRNVLMIVVRYFGGILLGTPGLIAAYREAATAALQAADIVTRTREQQAVIEFDYSAMNNVMKIIKERSIRVVSQHTDMRCTLTISAPVSVMEVALPQLAKFTSSPSS
ncbi:MAG: YigZ family protein [Bacteroidaceae bacterium]|nr:YigZ family protein [Bacteroidaceae bacterium]